MLYFNRARVTFGTKLGHFGGTFEESGVSPERHKMLIIQILAIICQVYILATMGSGAEAGVGT